MTAVNRTTYCATWRLASALTGAALLAVALPGPGSAQQSDPSARTAQSDQTAATRPAPKPAKPVVRPSAERNAKTTTKTPEAQGRPWTLQDAMPDHSASMRQYDTRLYLRAELDGAHRFYGRLRFEYNDWNSGRSFDGRGDEFINRG